MTNLFVILAPVALFLPLAHAGEGGPFVQEDAKLDPKFAAEMAQSAREASTIPEVAPVQNQVRIEQRVVVRIAPRSATPRNNLMADLPSGVKPTKLVEKKMANCIPVKSIAGVQTGQGNRLTLYLRDRRMVSVNLGKSCRARDFYSGFYVERNKDGNLCVKRDLLQSRSGAKCEVSRMRQLVPVRN